MNLKSIVIVLFVFALYSCDSGYQKENGKWVLVSYDAGAGRRVNQIDDHDVESFTVLKNDTYASDKNFVFYDGRIIEDANPSTFQVLNNHGYSKDGNHVFF